MNGDYRHHPHRSARRPAPGTEVCGNLHPNAKSANDTQAPCTYRVTLPTRRGAFLLGFHTADGMHATYLGTVIERYWLTLPRIMPIVRHLAHVVMPSGLHGIIRITAAARWRSDAMMVREKGARSDAIMVREAGTRYTAGMQRLFVRHGDTVHWSPRETIDNVQDVITAFVNETNRVFRLMQGISEPGLWARDVKIQRLNDERVLRRARIELRRMRRAR